VAEMHPLGEVFEVGRELDTFGSIAELKNKIRYYLDHPEQRMEMARRAAERALRDHSMAQRMARLLEVIQADEPSDKLCYSEFDEHFVDCTAQ
jgi:spore maturation protein CgeB